LLEELNQDQEPVKALTALAAPFPASAPPIKKSRIEMSRIVNNVRQLPSKVANFLRSSAAYMGAGVNGAIGEIYALVQKKLSGTRAIGCMWLATHFLLKRKAIQQARSSSRKDVILDTVWIDNPQMVQNAFCSYFTDKLGHLEEVLCERARNSLKDQLQIWGMSVQQVKESTSWMPPRLSQPDGPDAVWVTSCVLGEVSKFSNPAWDRLFRNQEELNELMQSEAAPLESPLCECGLFALVGILNPEDELELARQYFWQFLSPDFKSYSIVETSGAETTHYETMIEFVATCRDKWGNELECGFWIQCNLANCGALITRSIRVIPEPQQLHALEFDEDRTLPIIPANITFMKNEKHYID